MIEMKVSFDTDLGRAMEDTKVWAALALTGEQKMGIHDAIEMEEAAKAAEPVAHRRWLVSADPDEHVEQIAPYLDYGFNHLVFHFPGPDQEAAIARYGELILPRLRARFGGMTGRRPVPARSRSSRPRRRACAALVQRGRRDRDRRLAAGGARSAGPSPIAHRGLARRPPGLPGGPAGDQRPQRHVPCREAPGGPALRPLEPVRAGAARGGRHDVRGGDVAALPGVRAPRRRRPADRARDRPRSAWRSCPACRSRTITRWSSRRSRPSSPPAAADPAPPRRRRPSRRALEFIDR